MSIDDRLTTGLAANTRDLVSDPELEHRLSMVLLRAGRRQRARRIGLALVGATAAAVAALWLGGALDFSRDDDAPEPAPRPDVTEIGAPSMEGIDGPLLAGDWTVPLYDKEYESLPWAVVDVPEGYGSPGGWTVDRGADGDPENYGAVDFWVVDTLPPDACHIGSGVTPGPTVRDLADALTDATGDRATAPEPVTLDGHSGLYLEVTAPGRKKLATCSSGAYTLWHTDSGMANRTDIPGTAFEIWILDVDGTRIAVNETTTPHETKAQKAEVRAIAESTHFVDPEESSP